jgi:hypothetical protein
MKRVYLILITVALGVCLKAQRLREFSADTALFVSEMVSFTGTSLESTQVPDFERFLQFYDSLSFDTRMEVIEISNLMLLRNCRPRPHFIKYQQIMLEFFANEKTYHGYEEWLEGFRFLLSDEQTLLRTIDQWLTISLSLLRDNILYGSNAVSWVVATPDFQFQTEQAMAIQLENVTMVCYAGRDSILIREVSGQVDPLSLQWRGNYGKVTWERTGLPADEIYAILGKHTIDLKTPGYTADSVKFYYPAFFEGIALGRLEDRVSQFKTPSSAKYPQFISYQNSYFLEDLVPGIDYRGGLSMEGASVIGSGVEGKPALLEIGRNDTVFIRAETYRVSMNQQFIRSPSSRVSIRLEEDSIFHPDLVLTFDARQDQVRLNKSEVFTSQGPYSNTYHHVDMNFEELSWNRAETTMNFKAPQGTSIGRATFESNTFFNYDFFMELQGMDYEHPLTQLYNYSNMLGGRTFALLNYANYMGFSEYQVRHQLMSLSMLGFLYYDDDTDLITLRQKLFDYIIASMRQRDYDVIRFISRTESIENAELNLSTKDLTIKGIPVIFLSDSQNVRLVPEENQIVMQKNRSFKFDGVVDAGMFRFSGHDFFFDYDSFKIELENIDSLQMSIQTGQYNQYGEPLLTRIDNAIEVMSGELLIDKPDNKSGLESHPEYPIFSSMEESYIFYDRADIQNGVYNRDEFYFRLDPFTLDSMDNFRPEAIRPEGTFISAGILPPLQMEMSLRQDNSLGFYMQAPEEGIPLYGGVGTFYNDIEMSNGGLRGFGSLDYLTSTTWSDNFLLHPDSLMALSQRVLIRERMEEVQYPYVENTEALVKLIPSSEVMHLSRTNETFRIFNDSIFHGGNLALSPIGLSGDGVMGLPDARFEADYYSYGARTIRSDSAGVQFKDPAHQEYPFKTNDVSMLVELDSLRGEFIANHDASLVELPYNMYETRVDKMNWSMDTEEVVLTQSRSLPENNVDIGIDSVRTNAPTYRSVLERQEGLSFVSPRASYNYRTRILNARDVPFIEVADAYIFPLNGDVEVGEQASVGLLENARVLASKENRQHLIYEGKITIISANEYAGVGYYDYRDAFGNSYPIYFERIWVDSTRQSVARGQVAEADTFMLSPYFDFQGDVSLAAKDMYLTFDGGARIVHDCNIRKDWLRFTSLLDPQNIKIPVSEQMQNVALNKIFSGSMITRDSTHIYAAFLSGRKDYFDANITGASGVLVYDPELESYIISTPDKIEDPSLPGQYLRLERANCLLYGEGPIDLTLDYGQVQLTAAGNASHRVEEDLFSVNLIMGMDFPFSTDALEIMGSEIDSLPDLEPVNMTRENYRLAMRDLLGRELANRLDQQLGLMGVYDEIPPSWKHTIFFNELPLVWNQETRSFRYSGKVGIGNIGDIQVNKKVDAYIEMVERGSGDTFDMYLRAGDRTWYYIAYSPGGLQVLSSNRVFNDIVMNLKASDRRVKAKRGQAQYVYSLAAQRRLELFIDRFLEYEDGGAGDNF